MTSIDPRTAEGVAHVARLSRLALGADELAAMGEHLAAVLDYVEVLRELPTEGVSAELHDRAASGGREDVVRPSLERDQALANAPERDAQGFCVPAVLAE